MAVKNDTLIQIRSVSKRYRRGHETITALDAVSLDIHKGELLAVVGPSGSGKTTFTHVVGGLMSPSEGEIFVEGKALQKQSDRVLSRYRNKFVGFIFQHFSLIPFYTATENVTIPLIVANMRPGKRRERAHEFLRMVGLQHRMDQRADQLSGGERQRVAIARALVNHPKLIIADEPTGSLDSTRGNEVMNILEKLARTHGITVVMVTHDESLAARADRIIHIKDGKIVKEQHRARN